MVLSTIAGLAGDKLKKSNFLSNVPQGKVYNQGFTTSQLDVDSGRFAPRAVMQVDAETFGTQNSPLINQDIVIEGNFTGVKFTQVTENNLALDNGIVTINPTINSKVSNALLYQGYAVLDGDL